MKLLDIDAVPGGSRLVVMPPHTEAALFRPVGGPLRVSIGDDEGDSVHAALVWSIKHGVRFRCQALEPDHGTPERAYPGWPGLDYQDGTNGNAPSMCLHDIGALTAGRHLYTEPPFNKALLTFLEGSARVRRVVAVHDLWAVLFWCMANGIGFTCLTAPPVAKN